MKVTKSVVARKIISRLCEDKEIKALHYDVFYEEGEVNAEAASGVYVQQQGEGIMVMLCLKGEAEPCDLFTLEPSGNMWTEVGAENDCEKMIEISDKVCDKIAARLSCISLELDKEIVALGMRENKGEVRNAKYAVMHVSNSMAFSLEQLCSCGEFILPQFSELDVMESCVVGKDVVSDILLDHLDAKGSYVMPGHVVAYHVDGEDCMKAVLITKSERASLSNSGGYVSENMYQEIPTFNYTIDTVANDQYVFFFDEKKVVPVASVDLEGLYLAAELTWELDEWRVVAENDKSIIPWDACVYDDFETARGALDEVIKSLSEHNHWEGKPMREASPFGLESILKEKCERRDRKEVVMTDRELLDALDITGLEISGKPRKVARFLEALGVVTERLR